MKERFIVYQTQCKVNGKIYVGIHRTKNIDDGYLGSGVSLNLAISKYGRDSFDRTILFEGKNYEEILEKEGEIVNADFIKRPDVYNISLGGTGGLRLPGYKKKSTSKYSDAFRKRWADPSYADRVKANMKGKKKNVIWSNERRAKHSEMLKNRRLTNESREKLRKSLRKIAKQFTFTNLLSGEQYVGCLSEFCERFSLNKGSALTRFNSPSKKYLNWIREG